MIAIFQKKRVEVVVVILISICFTVFFLDTFRSRTSLAELALKNDQFALAYFLRPNSATDLMLIGNYYLQEDQNLKRAVWAYREALQQDKKVPFAHHQLSRIYFIQTDFTNARREINEELKLDPDNFRSLYVRALNEAYSGNMPGATEDFRRVLDLAPTEWGTYNDLSWVLAEQGQFEEAASVARAGIATAIDGAENPWLWNALGVALFNMQEYAPARDAFKNAGEYAKRLSEEEWHRAYSANNRSLTTAGLISFKSEIQKNIVAVESRLEEKQ